MVSSSHILRIAASNARLAVLRTPPTTAAVARLRTGESLSRATHARRAPSSSFLLQQHIQQKRWRSQEPVEQEKWTVWDYGKVLLAEPSCDIADALLDL